MKNKTSIYIILVVLVLLSVFNFLIVQTDFFQSKLGIHFNSEPVLVATRNIHLNEQLTAEDVKVVYMPKSNILKDTTGTTTGAYILTSVEQLNEGLVANSEILAGEQIPVSRLKSIAEADTSKTSNYFVPIDFDGSNGNTLYVGDEAYLWYTYKDKETTVTNQFFDNKITITDLKDSNGVSINQSRDVAAVIPSRAFFRADENDIKKIEELKNKGAKFFFVKEV